jgi:hypothetical protein
MPVSDHSGILEHLDRQEAVIGATAGIAKESHARLPQIEGKLARYNAFTETLMDTIPRSSRRFEHTVLNLRRTEYL